MGKTQAEKRAARFVANYLEAACKATGQPLTRVVDEFAIHLVRCDHAADVAERLGQTALADDLRTSYRGLRDVVSDMPVATENVFRALAPHRRQEALVYVARFSDKVSDAYDERRGREAFRNPLLMAQFHPTITGRLNSLETADLGAMADLAEEIIANDPLNPERDLLRAAVAACVGRLVRRCAHEHYQRFADDALRDDGGNTPQSATG